MTLRIRYQSFEFPNVDIHLRGLWDKQQFLDIDEAAAKVGVSPSSWAFFGVVWPSALILAHLMSDFPVSGKRILEVGCGLGLASLMLGSRSADITASDHNPAAAGFLIENTKLNVIDDIPFIRSGWADANSELGEYDLIIGSDLLYEPDHVTLLSGFIQRHTGASSEIVLVDAGRGYHRQFAKAMVRLGFVGRISPPPENTFFEKPFKGYVLRYQRQK